MNDMSGLEPFLVVLAVGVPIGIAAVLGLGRLEGWRVRRRNARETRALQQQRSVRRLDRNTEHRV